MKKTLLSTVLVGAMMALSVPAFAAKPVAEVSDATVDAVIKKMEANGALDSALQRAINRLSEKAQAEREQQQAQRDRAAQAMAQKVPGAQSGEFVRGTENARFTLIEYSDVECPFCKQYHASMEAVMQAYPGKVNWVWRHFPLSFHGQAAQSEAQAAECAGKLGGGKAFWSAMDYMMAHTASNGKGLPSESPFADIAAAAKVSASALQSCLDSDDGVKAKVASDYNGGIQLGVNGTPTTFVLDNKTKKVVSFAQALPPEALKQRLADIMNAAQ